jgi:uncharacterized protein (TIGR02145 family)
VKDLVPANGDSLTVKLYASYKPDNTDETKYAYLEIRVEDGTCICPAKKDANTWVNFMCHNLGGEDIISSSQLITRAHHGDWYRFGAKNPSMKNTPAHDTDNTWDNANYYISGNWPDNENENIGNPCPAGWQLPSITELAAVINKNANGNDIGVINPLTDVPASWLPASNQTFSNLKKSGDYLYLPAAGDRHVTGLLLDRGGYGYYWSSTLIGHGRYIQIHNVGNTTVSSVDSEYAMTLRCVEKE